MKTRTAVLVIALTTAPLAARAPAPKPPPEPTPPGTNRLIGIMPDIEQRLAALEPGHPEAYLELGEEVLALGADDLARRLFALAYELARTGGQDPATQTSACIALADTARFERERRWLWSIARLIEPRYNMPDWGRTTRQDITPRAALRAATTLGLLRAGEGNRARELLRDPAVRDVFTRYAGLLTGTGPGDVLSILDEQADRWPCPECRNDRVVRTTRDGQTVSVRCFTCRGNPGWELGEQGFLSTLRFESRVLAGVQRSWGAQLAADLAEPLRDPDPAAVCPAVGIDPSRSVYRDGAWVKPR